VPSRATHRALTALAMDGYDGDPAHAAIDSTARAHGPSHRHDEVHSLPGVALELAKRGQLSPQNLLAAQHHLVQDAAVDGMLKATGLRGPSRAFVKDLLEKAIVRGARRL
jgi:hypothetical protein